MYGHYLMVAWRNLLKYKLQSVISVLGLAVGLSCFVICSQDLQDNVMWNRRLPHADEMCLMTSYAEGIGVYHWVNANVMQRLCADFPEIEKAAIYYNMGGYTDMTCVVEEKEGESHWRKEDFIFTDSSFINFFGFRLLQGNWEQVKRQSDAVVVTESAALRIFGSREVIGREFTNVKDFNSIKRTYRVAAVMEDFPLQTELEGKGGLVINPMDPLTLAGAFEDAAQCMLLLRKGVKTEAFNEKLTRYMQQHPDLAAVRAAPAQAVPYLEMRGKLGMTWPLIMSGLGLLVLLAAMFNYVLFLSGRMLNRQKEYGVRQITGATPRSVFGMFVMEVSVTLVMVVLISFVFTEWLVHLLKRDISIYMNFDDRRNWMFFLGGQTLWMAVVLWGCMVGICRLLLKRMRSRTVACNLQGGGGVHYKSRIQLVLLGLQLTICLLFGGGAYFLYAQQQYLNQKMAGKLSLEECRRIYSLSLNGDKLKPIRKDILNMIAANPYIEAVTRNGNSLLGPWLVGEKNWQMEGVGEDRGQLPFMYVDANYPEFVHARMEEGRFFGPNEPECAVVNREFVRRYGVQALGKDIGFTYFSPMAYYHIVGIIEDILPVMPDPRPEPCLYLPYPNDYPNETCYVRLKPGASVKVLDPMREKMQQQVNAFTPLYIESLYRDISMRTIDIREIGMLMGLLAGVCILISLLGIYSSMMLAVEKRGREMAIRKINGATLGDIARIFLLHYARLAVGAAAVAFPLLYLGVNRWLQGYSDTITVQIWPFVCLLAGLFLVILLTIGSQLLKIIRINPVDSLKND